MKKKSLHGDFKSDVMAKQTLTGSSRSQLRASILCLKPPQSSARLVRKTSQKVEMEERD